MARRDAIRIKDVPGTAQLLVDLKPRRCDSDVFINQPMDVTELVKYVEKAKKAGKEITFFHVFMTAFGKLLYNRRKLNWFVQNRHFYDHKNVSIGFVAKVAFDDKAEEMMIIIPFDDKDTIETVSKKIKDKVNGVRNGKKVEKKGGNSAVDALCKLPNPIRIPIVGFLKWMDKKGCLPASIQEDLLYYSSAIVSNLGSIRCGAIYHNITNFGTASSLTTMGEIKSHEIIDENGKKKIVKLCDFGMNIDERVADGFYFAKSLQLLQYMFDHPETLEEPMDKPVEMPQK